MPPATIRLLRLSLVSLVVGAALGAWLLATTPSVSPWAPRLRAAHIHLMVFGWLVPFVLGTAYWMLPRHPEEPARGSTRAATLAVVLLGAGVALGAAGPLAGSPVLARSGQGAVLLGALTFLRLLWPRVKPFGVPSSRRQPAGPPAR
jgi:hypothetical protein